MPATQKKHSAEERQEMNNTLAALAKTGNSFALGQLWEINKGFIRSRVWKWYADHQRSVVSAGFDAEDLETESFFAVKSAVENYDPAAGNFTTYLSYWLQNRMERAIINGSGKYIVNEEGRKLYVPADPLHDCGHLDEPVLADESGETTKLDFVADPDAQQPFDEVEHESYLDALHEALEAAFAKLDEEEQAAVRLRWLSNCTLRQTGEQLGTTPARARQIESKGFRKLHMDKALKRWYLETLDGYAWRGTGFGAWKNGGSVEERTVELLEKRGAYSIKAELPAPRA